jgi:membrane protease YdiL (CAAX protease family)
VSKIKLKRNRARPPRVEKLASFFASFPSGCLLQLALAAVGLVVLGMIGWVVFFDPNPPPGPMDWRAWRLRDVVLIFLAWLSLAALEHVGWKVFTHEWHVWRGRPLRALISNLGLVATNVLAILVAVDVFGLRVHGQRWAALGLRPVSAGWLLGSLGLGLVSILVTGAAFALTLRLLGRPLTNPQDEFMLPAEDTTPPPTAPADEKAEAVAEKPAADVPAVPAPSLWPGALGMLLLVGLATPFCEEVLFRGVLYDWLRERMGVAGAVLLSAVLFGLAHLRTGIPVAVGAGVAGVILALAFEYSGSLWAPITIHTVVNTTKVVVLYLTRARPPAPQPA